MENKSLNLLKVGVTGHRFINHKSLLIKSVHQLLTEFSIKYADSEIHLYSALAEGSDQLIAELVKEYPKIKLVVPLPLSINDYLRDFESENAKQNFHELLQMADHIIYLPSDNDHETAYQNLGKFLTDECDYLIAIWDGEYSNKKGGTGEVVKMAIELTKPVYWVYCEQISKKPINTFANKKLTGEIELI